jgi:serine/threonine protein kinase
MPLANARIHPGELLGYNLNKVGNPIEISRANSSSSTDDGFDMPMQMPNERRGTMNDMNDGEEDENEMLVETLGSLVIYDRSQSIKPPSLKDFNFIQRIGNGSFGNVYLVKHMQTDNFYAVKSIRKDKVLEQEALENLKLEKLILLQAYHPFIVKMDYVFQKKERIYFMMDFVQGGDFYKLMEAKKRVPIDHTRFYIAGICYGLNHLHNKRIIYRDLKPENILLDHEGYAILADFGLAKQLDTADFANSYCGTPEYLCKFNLWLTNYFSP